MKTIAPINVKTEKELLMLNRDNLDAGEHWILINENTTTIGNKAEGNYMRIPRKDFNKLIRFYLREQKLKSKHLK